jgi:hypothetical protein
MTKKMIFRNLTRGIIVIMGGGKATVSAYFGLNAFGVWIL